MCANHMCIIIYVTQTKTYMSKPINPVKGKHGREAFYSDSAFGEVEGPLFSHTLRMDPEGHIHPANKNPCIILT